MNFMINLADRAILPDSIIRMGIRKLDRKRLADERKPTPALQADSKRKFVEEMNRSPIAIETRKANEQHYELPADFFVKVLGRRLKYSSCYWPKGAIPLTGQRLQPATPRRTAGGADHAANPPMALGGTAFGTGRLQGVIQFSVIGQLEVFHAHHLTIQGRQTTVAPCLA